MALYEVREYFNNYRKKTSNTQYEKLMISEPFKRINEILHSKDEQFKDESAQKHAIEKIFIDYKEPQFAKLLEDANHKDEFIAVERALKTNDNSKNKKVEKYHGDSDYKKETAATKRFFKGINKKVRQEYGKISDKFNNNADSKDKIDDNVYKTLDPTHKSKDETDKEVEEISNSIIKEKEETEAREKKFNEEKNALIKKMENEGVTAYSKEFEDLKKKYNDDMEKDKKQKEKNAKEKKEKREKENNSKGGVRWDVEISEPGNIRALENILTKSADSKLQNKDVGFNEFKKNALDIIEYQGKDVINAKECAIKQKEEKKEKKKNDNEKKSRRKNNENTVKKLEMEGNTEAEIDAVLQKLEEKEEKKKNSEGENAISNDKTNEKSVEELKEITRKKEEELEAFKFGTHTEDLDIDEKEMITKKIEDIKELYGINDDYDDDDIKNTSDDKNQNKQQKTDYELLKEAKEKLSNQIEKINDRKFDYNKEAEKILLDDAKNSGKEEIENKNVKTAQQEYYNPMVKEINNSISEAEIKKNIEENNVKKEMPEDSIKTAAEATESKINEKNAEIKKAEFEKNKEKIKKLNGEKKELEKDPKLKEYNEKMQKYKKNSKKMKNLENRVLLINTFLKYLYKLKSGGKKEEETMTVKDDMNAIIIKDDNKKNKEEANAEDKDMNAIIIKDDNKKNKEEANAEDKDMNAMIIKDDKEKNKEEANAEDKDMNAIIIKEANEKNKEEAMTVKDDMNAMTIVDNKKAMTVEETKEETNAKGKDMNAMIIKDDKKENSQNVSILEGFNKLVEVTENRFNIKIKKNTELTNNHVKNDNFGKTPVFFKVLFPKKLNEFKKTLESDKKLNINFNNSKASKNIKDSSPKEKIAIAFEMIDNSVNNNKDFNKKKFNTVIEGLKSSNSSSSN